MGSEMCIRDSFLTVLEMQSTQIRRRRACPPSRRSPTFAGALRPRGTSRGPRHSSTSIRHSRHHHRVSAGRRRNSCWSRSRCRCRRIQPEDLLSLRSHLVHVPDPDHGVLRCRREGVQEDKSDKGTILMIRGEATEIVQELHRVPVPHGTDLSQFPQHVKPVSYTHLTLPTTPYV